MKISTIGIDLAKSVFAIHGVDEKGETVLRKTLRRSQVVSFFAQLEPCLIGMEACSSAHYWGRELAKLGHDVRLMPPSYVKAYVKRGKTDAIDAEASCEAVRRPSMRFVPVKSAEEQALLALHRARDLLVRQKTQIGNTIRGLFAEFGFVAAPGKEKLAALAVLLGKDDTRLPLLARTALAPLFRRFEELDVEIASLERQIVAAHRGNEASRRLAAVPGIGPLTATALIASIGDVSRFKSGRDLAAWIGLTPQPRSTGGKERLGRVSKQGNRYLRRLLVQGAMAVLFAGMRRSVHTPWIAGLLARKRSPKVVALALANKMARIAWVLLARNEAYRPAASSAAA
jgi:transposase